MDDNIRKQKVYEENRKSVGLAYLLWFLFGFLALHRFYTGDTKSALVRLGLFISAIGIPIAALLWLIDAFRVPAIVNRRNMKTIEMINGDAVNSAPSQERIAAPPEPEPSARKVEAHLDKKRQAMLDDLRRTGYRKERREQNPLFR